MKKGQNLADFLEKFTKKMTFFYKIERAHAAFICITSIFITTKDHMYMYLFQKENVSVVWCYDIRHIFLEHSEKTRFFRKKCAFGCTYFCNKCCLAKMSANPMSSLQLNMAHLGSIVLVDHGFENRWVNLCDYDQSL